MSNLPKNTKAIVVQKEPSQSAPDLKHGAALTTIPIQELNEGEVLVKIAAVAFNHRDVRNDRSQSVVGSYAENFDFRFGSVKVCIPISGSEAYLEQTVQGRLLLLRIRTTRIEAPEAAMGVIGGVNWPSVGTFAEYVVVPREEVLASPSHLDDVHVAAWPLAGVTAWRATMINGLVSANQNVLITGIGGGVALTALQLCVAKGANVYVTSGSPEKIEKAKELGAKGGVSYKDSKWGKNLQALLEKTSDSGGLDVVIDSGGGDVFGTLGGALKTGGRVVCYGMHATPEIKYTMRQVMRNQKLLGSTMGSIADLQKATEFLAEHEIVPVLSTVLEGLERAEDGFQLLEKGGQFGKVVVKVDHNAGGARL
ncbi:hypothetical protein PQX77_011409 [Marasmius sp. AFHP31]|nr:hypothetical protein PQX77_011409 [Marasmius sp. AFHP31]